MIRLAMMFAAVLLMSTAGGAAHAKMAMQTFPVLAGAGAHDVYPAPDGQSGSLRNPPASSADWIPRQASPI